MMATSEQTRPINVLIVDDHAVVRDGLSGALSAEPDIKVVGQAADGSEATGKALQLKPDVIIMDVFMPNRTGLEALLAIKQLVPSAKVLFLTVSEREDDLFRAIRLGADGYLLKKSTLCEIVSSVRRVCQGEAILSPAMTARLLSELRSGPRAPALSTREKEVLALISRGLTTSEIAGQLSVSPGTVSAYIHRLLQKLHCKNRAEAMAYFHSHHLDENTSAFK